MRHREARLFMADKIIGVNPHPSSLTPASHFKAMKYMLISCPWKCHLYNSFILRIH
jgi:hypothetical protein